MVAVGRRSSQGNLVDWENPLRVRITSYTSNPKFYHKALGSNVVIKDVDEAAYRNLRGEAVKAGLKVGEAASQAFRLWVQQRSLGRVRDSERMRRAAERMDEMRRRIGRVEGWSSTEVIRQWRELRKQ